MDSVESIFYEEVAADFVEGAVGKYRWVENWSKLKKSGIAISRIETWLRRFNIHADPNKVAQTIDDMMLLGNVWV